MIPAYDDDIRTIESWTGLTLNRLTQAAVYPVLPFRLNQNFAARASCDFTEGATAVPIYTIRPRATQDGNLLSSWVSK